MKNVGKEEGIFRIVIGGILIVLSFFTFGIFRWVAGLAGVAVILTALFGY